MTEKKEPAENRQVQEEIREGYKWYQGNVRRAGELVYALTKGARGDLPLEDLLGIALKTIDRMAGTVLCKKWEEKEKILSGE